MQIDTPEGNLSNQKGTVSGESGSRKQQKLSYFWGDIKVRMSSSNPITFIHLFEDKEEAVNFTELVDVIYADSDVRTFKREGMSEDQNENGVWVRYNKKKPCFVVCVNLSFNIGLTTYHDKFTKACKISQMFNMRVLNSMEDKDDDTEFEEIINRKLNIMFKNDIFGINWNAEFEKAKQRAIYAKNNNGSSKKRKLNFD